MAPTSKRPPRRIAASVMLDPRGVAGVLPTRGGGGRPWDLYRQVPELRSAIEWLANAISRADLYVARRTAKGVERVDDPAAIGVLDDLFGPGSGASQSDLLKRIVTHLEAAGETYLVPISDPQTGPRWVACSTLEIRSTGGCIEVQTDINTWTPATGKALRIWHPDSVQSWRADSPILAVEPVLQTIIALTARATAIGESRLAGSGIFCISDNLSVEMPSSEGSVNPVRSRDVVTALEDAMLEPMQDRGLASAVVPIILVGPKEDLPTQDSFINLASPLDEKAREQLDHYLRRMANSLGLPPEMVLGLGESNHWNAYVIVDQAVTTSIEPRTDTITSALTTGYARPRWRELRIKDADNLFIAADLTDLTVRPDRSEAAGRARQQGLITDEAWALHTGFDQSVLPTGEERKRMILEKVLASDPSAAPWILPELGIHILGYTTGEGGPARAREESAPADPVPALDTPRPSEPRSTDPGEPPRPVMSALGVEETLITAVEAAAIRVLERSGGRLRKAIPRSDRGQYVNTPTLELHTALPVTADIKASILAGAYKPWEETLPHLVPIVATYVEYLIDHRIPHSRELLTEAMVDRLIDLLPAQETACA